MRHIDRKATSRSKLIKDSLTCKPLDSLDEIQMFLDNPPSWRTLCKELTPHSKFVIRNIEVSKNFEPSLEIPENYCHFDPDADAPTRYDVTEKKLPKTLVCHDMANGYHDDSKIEGTQQYDAYTFYNWAGIDIFCYFSHHLITIPPVSWINVGHAHGVKVIGTIITEWGEGVAFWDKILSSELEYKNFASAVVAIARILKFDGWLLNIENKIAKPEKLLDFVRYLHKTLHDELAEPVLIWYDSVTVNGNLNWQNGLNEKNKAFFDACDGFFTNYSWTVNDVENSVKAAGERVTDVFVGLDVWGRNFFGGGQLNVQEAMKVAFKAGCSLAIFAPAWTHEAMYDESKDAALAMSENFSKLEKFVLRDRALWGSMWPFFTTHMPCQLPFQTSFCRGQGKKRWMYGEVISPGPWYNLRHQQYQPNSAHGQHGYILSSIDKIMRVSWIVKDDKGIIKYRQDQEALRSVEVKPTGPSGNDSDSSGDYLEESPAPKKIRATFSNYKEKTMPLGTEDILETEVPEMADSDQEIDKATQTERKKTILGRIKDVIDKVSSKPSEQATTSSSMLAETNPPVGASLSNRLDKETADLNLTDQVDNLEGEPRELTNRSMVAMSINLNLKSDQLKTRWALAHVPNERECFQLCLDDAFCGGSCIKINPSDKINPDHRITRLFHCDFQCEDTLIVCVVTKTTVHWPDQALNVKLKMVNVRGQDLTVVLTGHTLESSTTFSQDSTGIVFSYPIYSQSQEAFRELREYLLLNEPSFYIPLENFYGWNVRYYMVKVPGSRITEVYCRTVQPEGGILLGYLGICHRNTKPSTSSAPP